jgi:hypothetical protein
MPIGAKLALALMVLATVAAVVIVPVAIWLYYDFKHSPNQLTK